MSRYSSGLPTTSKEAFVFRNPLTDGLVVIVVLLLFFGPKRLPMLSRSIGESIKEFKGGITHGTDDSEDKAQLSSGEETSATSKQPAETGSER
jgi:TatA/E family protein of Tat protein translocase